MRQKTLLIFGAGASKADKAPLQNELFSEFFELLEGAYDLQNISVNPAFIKEMKKFLYKLYPIDEEPKNDIIYPTFEEVMGLIHFAIIRDESFRGISYSKLRSYLESLTSLIAVILQEKLRDSPKVNRRFLECLYTTFQYNHNKNIKKGKLNGNFTKQFSFLNINYDILLDNALLDLKNKYGVDYDYCFKIKSRFNGIKLFKPHGSLNWLLCKSCGKIETGEYKKIALRYYESILEKSIYWKKCECGSALSPLIVPPSFFKELNNRIIQNVLINLENCLKEVENLIFIGYSFPEADLHLKYIFKRAQLYGEFKKIILINKKGGDKSYYNNVKRTFIGIDIIDLTPKIPDGLGDGTITTIVERIFENL